VSSALPQSNPAKQSPPTYDELLAQLHAREKETELLKEVGQHLSTQTELQPLLNLIAQKSKNLIGAESLLIPLINKEKTHYHYAATSGKNAELILGQKFPINIGMCGWVLSKEIPLLFGEGSEWLMEQKTHWEEGMQSALLVPLKSRGKIVGGISGMGKLGALSFTQQDLEMLTLFANQISTIIENVQIMEELSQEKARIQITLDSIADGVITTNEKGKVDYLNPVAEEMTGWLNADAKGKPIEQILPLVDENNHSPLPSLIRQSLQEDRAFESTRHRTLLNKNNEEFAITESAAPVHSPDQQIVGSILVFHDATETRKLTQQLSYQAYQAGLVEMATSLLHNIGNAINSVSVRAHSLKKDHKELLMIANILQQQKSQLLENNNCRVALQEHPEIQAFLNITEEAAKSLEEVVSSNLQSKTMEISKGVEHIVDIVRSQQKIANPSLQTEFQLEQAIEDAILLQQESLTQHNIDVHLSLDPAINTVKLPKNQFIQMMLNLLKNASEAIDKRREQQPGIGNLHIRGSLSAKNDALILQCKDDGCGIEAEKIPQLFKYGYSSKNRGSGFGLHSIATFVQSQGGEIKVLSDGVNLGTEFSIQFPLLASEQDSKGNDNGANQ